MQWDGAQYLQFEKERSVAAQDLLLRVQHPAPSYIVDLGCGPGNSTELLYKRFPQAEIVGIDSSSDMLQMARQRLPQLRFIECDIASWQPEKAVDLIFGNAVFQWVPNHLKQLARLAAALAPGGILAVQLPNNQSEPSHVLMRDLATDGPWASKLEKGRKACTTVHPVKMYYDILQPFSAQIDLWQTTYYHILNSPALIVEWMKGTGLRALLAHLDEAEAQAFLAEYEWELAAAYPPLADGKVLFPFPRLFIVAKLNQSLTR